MSRFESIPRLTLAVSLVALLGACGVHSSPSPPPVSEPLRRIAFGSCSHQDYAQPLWPAILDESPDLWVWLGDNIYGDSDDPAVLRAKYAMAQSDPGYGRLIQTIPVIGTWDDHDFGANDGGVEYPAREASQQLLLDFLGVPEDSPRRERRGVYSSQAYGPPGKRVRFILLDTRYDRDPIGSNGAVLSEEQWAWLEAELAGTDAQINVIGSSIQVIADQHPYEKWSNFPAERERLIEVIGASGAPGVILLSGDRHIAEVARLDDPRVGYPLYEVTSSGMTHTASEGIRGEQNRHRVGPLVIALNYGTIDIDWEAAPVDIALRVRGVDRELLLEQHLQLDQLRRQSARP